MKGPRTIVQFSPSDKETDLYVDRLWREFARWRPGKSEHEIAARIAQMKAQTWEFIVAAGKEQRYERFRPPGA